MSLFGIADTKLDMYRKKHEYTQEGEITAEAIDKGMLVDQHYYAIASKATLVKPDAMPVSPDKFQAAFGVSWHDALKAGSVYNALDACKARAPPIPPPLPTPPHIA